MKNKITLALTILGLLANTCIQAQMSYKAYGDKKDFIAMAKRPLLVELREEDPDVIKSLSKKEKTIKELKEYKSEISDYNEMIKIAVEKYWKYNENKEYKTASEVKKLKDLKNNKYVVLSYIQLVDVNMMGDVNMNGVVQASSGEILPGLCYTRIEQPDRTPDYRTSLPSSRLRKDNKYLECDFKLALTGIQAQFKWMIHNDKIVYYRGYVDNVWEANCPKLKNVKLQVEKSFLQQKAFLQKELTVAEAKETYGHEIEFVTAEELNSSYTESKKGTAVLFFIPYSMSHTMNNSANANMRQTVSHFLCFTVIVDCETNEILWAANTGFFSNKGILTYLRESDFKDMGRCK